MTTIPHTDSSEWLRQQYADRGQAITERLQEFSRVAPAEYYYELAYCLLTPQSQAEHAEQVVEVLRAQGFRERPFDPEPLLANRSHYIRFHRTKARRLRRLNETIGAVQGALENLSSPAECRSWLVKNVDGLGLKEATHFLRNIGRNGELAILDRHILRNLRRYGAIRSVPSSLTTKQYERIEGRFLRFAEAVGIPINHLDLLFWSLETGVIRK
jgi:N-glycosylase/DNA lyase